jgi:hypothetical protein
MLPAGHGDNINGPSLVRVPEWVPGALGRYYLYFAHHRGKYIRLAVADALEGPWRVFEGGALRLRDAPGCEGHIASPDVVVDSAAQTIRMYFHGRSVAEPGPRTFVAVSRDGLTFTASDEVLGPFYMRVFRWSAGWFGMSKGGLLHRSQAGLTRFERGPDPFPGNESRGRDYNDAGPRHVAVEVVGDRLWVYYSNIGDAPERILRTSIDLVPDWTEWRTRGAQEVVRPEREWEGAGLPVAPSTSGAAKAPEHALRDPALFTDKDGERYLLYSVAGERGIAIARLRNDVALG